jgi:hypothetical protein
MEPAPRSGTAAVGTFLNVLERLILFALALLIGLLNLLIGLVVAAHLGIVPKTSADAVLRVTNRATAVLTRIMGPARRAAPKHKANRQPRRG